MSVKPKKSSRWSKESNDNSFFSDESDTSQEDFQALKKRAGKNQRASGKKPKKAESLSTTEIIVKLDQMLKSRPEKKPQPLSDDDSRQGSKHHLTIALIEKEPIEIAYQTP